MNAMNEVNRTLYIPLYGKSYASKRRVILSDPTAESIWEAERFPIRGRARSKWLAYNMAMRSRVFDDWTDSMLARSGDALVLHVGCGLDGRCLRVGRRRGAWLDCDLPDVIAVRRKYYGETEDCRMVCLDASRPEQVSSLPDGGTAIAVLEGLSMYLTNGQLRGFLLALRAKYRRLRVLMDVYTVFGARASKYGNPVTGAGVTALYGVDDIRGLLDGSDIRVVAEHSFTPPRLVDELKGVDRFVFRLLFTGGLYGRLYRLIELAA